MRKQILFFLLMIVNSLLSVEDTMVWWHAGSGVNFGDDLSHVIVEKILGRPVAFRSFNSNRKLLLAAGSILHYAREGDVIWGSGFRENPMNENRFKNLDIRAVRGPLTREFLLKKGIKCPTVYGDPAVLMSTLFPEYKRKEPIYDYIIIPNMGEIAYFKSYKNVVLPTLPWREIVKKMMESRLVISSSLHGIIVAESYGVPTRLLKMTWLESILKYQDYYESTGRKDFRYATSVQEAIQMGGERPGAINTTALLNAFPWDYFNN